MGFTTRFDSNDGQVLYVPSFVSDIENITSEPVDLGSSFERTGHGIGGRVFPQWTKRSPYREKIEMCPGDRVGRNTG